MKLRTFLAAAAVAVFAQVAEAALSAQYLEWGRGPAQFLMTADEAAKWKTVTSDDDAKSFIALFWARRDPTPGTSRNEYREEIERRIDYADVNFGGERQKGAMTDRGRMFLLFGAPKRIGNSAEADREAWYQWTYEDEATFGVPRATLRFTDRFGMEEYKLDRTSLNLDAIAQRAIARTITRPDLAVAPGFEAPAPAAPVQTALATAALQKAIDDYRAAGSNPYRVTYATWGEYVTSTGEYFVPVMLYVPHQSGIRPAENLTFFGVVQDESGKNVSAFEVPASLTASKDDWFVDRSLTGLPAGKHRGYFGLAQNGTPLTLVSADMQLAGTLDRDAVAVSPLILSNNLYALEQAQAANDPYAFGGLKVVPKGDRTFRPTDELWFFVELRNPGTVLSNDIVPVIGAPVPMPKVQIRIEVEGTDVQGNKKKLTAPPRQIEVIPMKGVPNHYGIGNSIPLSSFRPGDYTFTMKVTDTVLKQSYTVSDRFRITD
jgi:GWxTD domain-containing protein